MSKTITTRTPAQIRSHAQKYFERLAESKTNNAEEEEEGVVIVSCRGSKRSGMILNGNVHTPAAKKKRILPAEHSCEQEPLIRHIEVNITDLPAMRRVKSPIDTPEEKDSDLEVKHEEQAEQQDEKLEEEEVQEVQEEEEDQAGEEEEELEEEGQEGEDLTIDAKREPLRLVENGKHSGVVSPLQMIEIVSKMGDVQSPLHKSRTGEETLSAELNAIHVLASAFHEH
jgi:hypothetical protein